MNKLLLLLLACCAPTGAWAQVHLAPLFTDHMVVRQKALNTMWGSAPSNTVVVAVASWAPHDTVRARANPSGLWSLVLPAPAADGKKHTIRVNQLELKDIVLGEVWLASGQSNMVWNPDHGIVNGDAVIAAATDTLLRFFKVPMRGALTPQSQVEATWQVCSPATMRRVSAVGYFFADALRRRLGVPVGVIESAWGGTPIEPWIPASVIETSVRLKSHAANQKNVWVPIEAGESFNQMIYPLAPYALSGTIWYQGEANRENAGVYGDLMRALIGSWRVAFGQPAMPFYFVQIAPFAYTKNGDLSAAVVREQQEWAWKTTPNTGMVVVMDCVPDVADIHPTDKLPVGNRLAAFALNEVYGIEVPNYKSPTFAGATFDKGRATVRLHDAVGLQVRKGQQPIVGLTVAGIEGFFVPAQGKINKDGSIDVWAKEVEHPTAVRYCFDDATVGNLMNAAGLPVAPFRSDAGAALVK